MTHKIFDYINCRKIGDMYRESQYVAMNWKLKRTPIPPDVKADMDRIVEMIEN